MNYAIILAGGIGSRFWPLSRSFQSKQFLNIYSNKPMVDETISRILPLFKKENIFIATNKLYAKKIKNCSRNFNIPLKNVLFEPEGKNTLAPIAFLSNRINKIDSDAVVAVLPSDHIVKYKDRFLKLLNKAIDVANSGYIVTFGIFPTRPETGYGYIKIKSKIKNQKSKIYRVDKFIEKPEPAKAKRLIKDKRFYWNSGIFVFKADTILKEIKKFMPNVYKIMTEIKNKRDLNRLWQRLPFISIDYAIMEKTKRMVLLPANYGWIDLGSWQAIEEIFKKDKDGNFLKGKYIDIGSKNCLVWADNRLVATLGLNNIIVVETKDAILVCAKDKSQDVKKIVQILKQNNIKD